MACVVPEGLHGRAWQPGGLVTKTVPTVSAPLTPLRKEVRSKRGKQMSGESNNPDCWIQMLQSTEDQKVESKPEEVVDPRRKTEGEQEARGKADKKLALLRSFARNKSQSEGVGSHPGSERVWLVPRTVKGPTAFLCAVTS